MFHQVPPQNYQRLAGPLSRRREVWSALMPRRGRAAFRIAISATLAVADALTICGLGIGLELGYYALTEGGLIPSAESRALALAGTLTLIVVLANALREEYGIENALSRKPHLRRAATTWLMAWGAMLVLGFATKTTNDFSRVVVLGLFVAGLPAMIGLRAAMLALVRRTITPEAASVSRVHLVGYEEDIARFYESHDAEALGLRVVGTSYLRRVERDADANTRRAQLDEDLDLAVSVVRFLRPDDVFILVPWGDAAEVDRCVDTFLRTPAAIHLRPGGVLDRFPDMQVARVGRLSGINIGRRPLSIGEILVKRAFDICVASLGLLAISPLMALVALAIKLDSPGPVFFRQRRYGFNQEPFGVFKFRSMRTEKNAKFVQATRNDSRITRVGAFLRRTNLDELPQLINVILGDMSLVGPRPHALAHDISFERRIAQYARRHNVRPGITGWAQVNGLRGETLTDLDMERRVSHDLHYIDNWSIWFDIQIMIRTFSPKAYRNAF
ncbi:MULTISPECIES: undecaprenyl-phosphate glucose phosphotransferase [Methylobacterium]|uniref:Bacterial sugar transferase domain-containing protein n=3 Tax=Pseudomonadota TaxID=1224 RepID=A0ABQ4SZG6_9HYPH|nr:MULTISPECIES: undecaprenyl-phosphate glucose phosphotransferase [Methylobacterium]PIU07080.1 MAG: undecaprenyl-phosphate glucose phosphotransferase [Methylobacterium sp. CG09_land_8_20_14_0_10_71_15]PIU12285.1 MAG: undecaprenyl-phosphate glucose phosphotransferase [Methylobacterium sp. CG08_land_8_20_14_0_20_71_15]GBU16773.1 hypothetical protein AwMethylo_09880 [Methylobacterium sp.]GJE07056.1 hypothetical protein AOPFMNJM_2380 [Methylobacterium jeotgali]